MYAGPPPGQMPQYGQPQPMMMQGGQAGPGGAPQGYVVCMVPVGCFPGSMGAPQGTPALQGGPADGSDNASMNMMWGPHMGGGPGMTAGPPAVQDDMRSRGRGEHGAMMPMQMVNQMQHQQHIRPGWGNSNSTQQQQQQQPGFSQEPEWRQAQILNQQERQQQDANRRGREGHAGHAAGDANTPQSEAKWNASAEAFVPSNQRMVTQGEPAMSNFQPAPGVVAQAMAPQQQRQQQQAQQVANESDRGAGRLRNQKMGRLGNAPLQRGPGTAMAGGMDSTATPPVSMAGDQQPEATGQPVQSKDQKSLKVAAAWQQKLSGNPDWKSHHSTISALNLESARMVHASGHSRGPNADAGAMQLADASGAVYPEAEAMDAPMLPIKQDSFEARSNEAPSPLNASAATFVPQSHRLLVPQDRQRTGSGDQVTVVTVVRSPIGTPVHSPVVQRILMPPVEPPEAQLPAAFAPGPTLAEAAAGKAKQPARPQDRSQQLGPAPVAVAAAPRGWGPAAMQQAQMVKSKPLMPGTSAPGAAVPQQAAPALGAQAAPAPKKGWGPVPGRPVAPAQAKAPAVQQANAKAPSPRFLQANEAEAPADAQSKAAAPTPAQGKAQAPAPADAQKRVPGWGPAAAPAQPERRIPGLGPVEPKASAPKASQSVAAAPKASQSVAQPPVAQPPKASQSVAQPPKVPQPVAEKPPIWVAPSAASRVPERQPIKPVAINKETKEDKKVEATPIFNDDEFVSLGAAVSSKRKGPQPKAKAAEEAAKPATAKAPEDKKAQEQAEEKKLAGSAWGKAGEEKRKKAQEEAKKAAEEKAIADAIAAKKAAEEAEEARVKAEQEAERLAEEAAKKAAEPPVEEEPEAVAEEATEEVEATEPAGTVEDVGEAQEEDVKEEVEAEVEEEAAEEEEEKPAEPEMEEPAVEEKDEEAEEDTAEQAAEEAVEDEEEEEELNDVEGLSKVCVCGNEFMTDSLFCRICGERRQKAADMAVEEEVAAEPEAQEEEDAMGGADFGAAMQAMGSPSGGPDKKEPVIKEEAPVKEEEAPVPEDEDKEEWEEEQDEWEKDDKKEEEQKDEPKPTAEEKTEDSSKSKEDSADPWEEADDPWGDDFTEASGKKEEKKETKPEPEVKKVEEPAKPVLDLNWGKPSKKKGAKAAKPSPEPSPRPPSPKPEEKKEVEPEVKAEPKPEPKVEPKVEPKLESLAKPKKGRLGNASLKKTEGVAAKPVEEEPEPSKVEEKEAEPELKKAKEPWKPRARDREASPVPGKKEKETREASPVPEKKERKEDRKASPVPEKREKAPSAVPAVKREESPQPEASPEPSPDASPDASDEEQPEEKTETRRKDVDNKEEAPSSRSDAVFMSYRYLGGDCPEELATIKASEDELAWRQPKEKDAEKEQPSDRAMFGTHRPQPREDDDRGGRGDRNRGKGGRGDRDRDREPAPKLKVSENAYKITDAKSLDREAELKRTTNSLLNKICPENTKTIADRIPPECKVVTEVELSQVIMLVFKKALAEPHYSETYADLVFHLRGVMPEFPNPSGGKNITFKSTLLNVCQAEFEAMPKTLRGTDEEVASMEEEEIEEESRKKKKKFLALMKFIGQLFLRTLLTTKIISGVMQDLMMTEESADKVPEEHVVECVCELLSTIGYTLEQQPLGANAITQVCGKMKEAKGLKKSGKGVLSKRIQFQIQDLLDMRTAGWSKKVFHTGAKTKEEIRAGAARDEREARPGEVKVHEHVIAGQRPAYLDQAAGTAPAANGPGSDWQEIPKKTTRR